MAYDAERTKRRAREAAIAEFAEHGQHGTNMEQIASRAGVNKQRIYTYFGDKAELFSTVVREEVEKVAEAVPLQINTLEDVGDFAGRTFDYLQAHPDLARLVIWEGMADTGAGGDDQARGPLYARKIAVVTEAQCRAIVDATVDPGHLVFMLLAITSWWTASPQIARLLTGADGHDEDERSRRRATVVEAAQRLARPHHAQNITSGA